LLSGCHDVVWFGAPRDKHVLRADPNAMMIDTYSRFAHRRFGRQRAGLDCELLGIATSPSRRI
jgi:hypothetical protein